MEPEALKRRWRGLLEHLHSEEPLRDMTLYVRPKRACADSVVEELLTDVDACPKFLLVGARGGGKSTELRQISHHLHGEMELIEIDLDWSGVTAESVSAYDLLYISALALLRSLPGKEGEEHFEELVMRYAGKKEERALLGDLSTALGGVAGFATGAAAAATTAGLAPGVAPAVGAVVAAVGQGLRLLTGQSRVVKESSPQGRALQECARKIALAVRQRVKKPICVLIDGLEKMNGEARERFLQVFQQTRLLADTDWAAVIAAPPCTLTDTNSVEALGLYTKPVWGFGSDDLEGLYKALKLRFEKAGFDPEREVAVGGIQQMVDVSGGLPRYAILLARRAAIKASAAKAAELEQRFIDLAIQEVAESLGRGLSSEHLRLMGRVLAEGELPGGDEAAKLFADGRILAYPPRPPGRMPRFDVHPLLREDVQQRMRSKAG